MHHLAIGDVVIYNVPMHTEFEATFSHVDIEDIRSRLTTAQATLVYPEFLMRRKIFSLSTEGDAGYMRVRQEANKITLAYKHNVGKNITDQKEVELTIDSFDEGVLFCSSIGAIQKAYQETRRELWMLGSVEIAIDTWPGLTPFVEIEAENEDLVKEAADTLGFDYVEALFGAVHVVYEKELGISPDVINNQTPEITFENPPQ